MAVGTLTLGSITFEVSGDDYTWQYQSNTINAAITPERSRYGTLQNPGVPSTNTPKYLWTITDAWMTNTQANTLRGYIANNATVTYSFTDSAKLQQLTGSAVSATVRLIADGVTVGDSAIAYNGTVQWKVSFQALQV